MTLTGVISQDSKAIFAGECATRSQHCSKPTLSSPVGQCIILPYRISQKNVLHMPVLTVWLPFCVKYSAGSRLSLSAFPIIVRWEKYQFILPVETSFKKTDSSQLVHISVTTYLLQWNSDTFPIGQDTPWTWKLEWVPLHAEQTSFCPRQQPYNYENSGHYYRRRRFFHWPFTSSIGSPPQPHTQLSPLSTELKVCDGCFL